jgi:hypothetical protein
MKKKNISEIPRLKILEFTEATAVGTLTIV